MIGLDSLTSLLSGLGTAKDKSSTLGFNLRQLSPEELNAMHRSDWLSRKIVDVIPNDMTREWRDWQADGEVIELIEKAEAAPSVSVAVKVNEALQLARLMGGSAIYIGIKGQNPTDPLVVESVGKDQLEFLRVLGSHELSCGELEDDITSSNFGDPRYYEGAGPNGEPVRVHPSRVVRFFGAPILDRRTRSSALWGDSILQVVYAAILNATSAQQHIAALIPEAKTDVIYIPKLSDMTKTADGRAKITNRFSFAATAKSMFNMLLLEGDGKGGGEVWQQKQISFAQLPELMRQFLQVAAGAADIPVTRLLGESPSGLNATGKSDLQNYYDNVAARQRTELTPAMHVLDEVIIRSATGQRDPAIHYTWAPLWGLSDKEKADIFKTKADAARAIAGTGGASPPLMPIEALSDALVNELVEDGSLSGLEAAIEEYGKLSEQDDEDLEEGVEEPAGEVVQMAAAANDAAPRTLYVSRQLLNADEFLAWANDQGFKSTLAADDLHVTLIYSRQAVDWMKMGESWSGDGKGNITVSAGGPRLVEPLGDKGAVVLLFSSTDLQWRHRAMVEAGASFDYDEYQPHVTITYEAGGIDLSKVQPYRGKLVFGPERFEELDAA